MNGTIYGNRLPGGMQVKEKCLGTTEKEEGLDSWSVTDRDETCRSSHRCPLQLLQEWDVAANILTVSEDIRNWELRLTFIHSSTKLRIHGS